MDRILVQLTAMQEDNRRFQNNIRTEIQQLRTDINQLRTEIETEMRRGFDGVNLRINVVYVQVYYSFASIIKI